jgi:hypothetical protein
MGCYNDCKCESDSKSEVQKLPQRNYLTPKIKEPQTGRCAELTQPQSFPEGQYSQSISHIIVKSLTLGLLIK